MTTYLLLVEDDAALARAVHRVLSRAGYTVTLAASCQAARVEAGPFHLGIFDIDLPDGDGVALGSELLSSGDVERAVFFSGSPAAHVRRSAERFGPFVEKASGVASLMDAIARVQCRSERVAAGAENATPVEPATAPPPSGVRRNEDE